MAELRLKTNNTFDTVITVRKSDKYSNQVYFKVEADVPDVGLRNCVDNFFSPRELFELGQFLVSESNKMLVEQYK